MSSILDVHSVITVFKERITVGDKNAFEYDEQVEIPESSLSLLDIEILTDVRVYINESEPYFVVRLSDYFEDDGDGEIERDWFKIENESGDVFFGENVCNALDQM
jgi:hypothetical protein